MEEWKNINNTFGENYEISNYGNLRNNSTNKILKYSIDDRAGLVESLVTLEKVMYIIRGEKASKLTAGELI